LLDNYQKIPERERDGKLREFGIEQADIPSSFLEYIGANSPGHRLLRVSNIDEYIFSGEITRSTFGPGLVDISRQIKKLSNDLKQAFSMDAVDEKLNNLTDIYYQLVKLNDQDRPFLQYPKAGKAFLRIAEAGQIIREYISEVQEPYSKDAQNIDTKAESALTNLNEAGKLISELRKSE
jgi:hypothetical protein